MSLHSTAKLIQVLRITQAQIVHYGADVEANTLRNLLSAMERSLHELEAVEARELVRQRTSEYSNEWPML